MSIRVVTNNNQDISDIWNECRESGIEPDPEVRWEKGIPHHPEAESIMKLLEESDWIFGNDYFEWEVGGDGDNGETLMYSLSPLLELRDLKQKEE